jgi:hypothetical protein
MLPQIRLDRVHHASGGHRSISRREASAPVDLLLRESVQRGRMAVRNWGVY